MCCDFSFFFHNSHPPPAVETAANNIPWYASFQIWIWYKIAFKPTFIVEMYENDVTRKKLPSCWWRAPQHEQAFCIGDTYVDPT